MFRYTVLHSTVQYLTSNSTEEREMIKKKTNVKILIEKEISWTSRKDKPITVPILEHDDPITTPMEPTRAIAHMVEDGDDLIYYGLAEDFGEGITSLSFREFPSETLLIHNESIEEIGLHLNALLCYIHTMRGEIPRPLDKDEEYTFEISVPSIFTDDDFR